MSASVLKTITLVLLVVMIAGLSWADSLDDDPQAVSLYAKGKRLLREGDWYGAVRLFEELEARFPHSKNLDLFLFNRAKARYHLADYADARAGFGYFVSRYPNSTLVAHAWFFLGNARYLGSDISLATRAWLKAYALSRDDQLDRLTTSSLIESFRNAASINLGQSDFEGIGEAKKCRLVRKLAKILLERGEFNRAGALLGICGEELNLSDEQSTRFQTAKQRLEIALLLPLSGEMHTYGQEIFNGATIAAEFYRQRTGREVKLVPYDSKGDPVEAARIAGEISRSLDTDALVGPLTSDEAAVVSAALGCATLPMIAPAATQAGLTLLSPTSFQLAPNIELEGITLANYAIDEVRADSVAIITSTATDDLRMARAFADHFESRGGTVLAIEYYRSRDKDFGPYIRDIKAILLGQPGDSTYYISADGDTLDLDVIPANIDCLFIPGSPNQLRQLLPQVHFYNLNGFYLGSDGWGDDVVYKLGDDVTKQAVFSSPFLGGRNSQIYLEFATAFDARFGSQPQRLASLGFDAVNLITEAVATGGISRDRIIERLRSVDGYDGASGRIVFGDNRENIEMPLYRIESRQAVPLDAEIEPEVGAEGGTE